jgi:hypothetical protein
MPSGDEFERRLFVLNKRGFRVVGVTACCGGWSPTDRDVWTLGIEEFEVTELGNREGSWFRLFICHIGGIGMKRQVEKIREVGGGVQSFDFWVDYRYRVRANFSDAEKGSAVPTKQRHSQKGALLQLK